VIAAAGARAGAGKKPNGLNENYGRELMELHTLGVDGGYTQKDVTEIARALTGWTIGNPVRRRFPFDARRHDTGQKMVLGHVIKGWRGRVRRRAGARHPRGASGDGDVHRDQADAPIRERHAAAGVGRTGGGALSTTPAAICAR